MKKNGLVLFGVLLALCFAGCKSKSNEMKMNPGVKTDSLSVQEAVQSSNGVVIRGVKQEELGMEAVCPVSQRKFKVGAATKAAEYKGKTYYFCCEACSPMFQKSPDKYVK
jgi:YHS domain-containing protein